MPRPDPMTTAADAPRLVFGLYPGTTGLELSNSGSLPEDQQRTVAALADLQPGGQPLLVRSHILYLGAGRPTNPTPADPIRYARDNRKLDLVVCYRLSDGDLDDWTRFLRQIVAVYSSHLDALQVAEEPNNPDAATGGDGGSRDVRREVVAGVVAAKEEATRRGLALNARP